LTKQHLKRRYWLAGRREASQDEFFVEALDSNVWEEGDAENWDSCWYTGMPDPKVFEQLDATKSINHIPGNNGLTIKDFLHNTLSSARSRLRSPKRKARMSFFPHVYSMPNQYHDWLQKAYDRPEHKWILKPKNSARGEGIEVVRDLADVPLDDRFMVQDYLDKPHLINERKYVLRLYVLISSVEPLRVYLYNEGFAKLASDPYDLNDLDNPFSHLTNPDINALNSDAEAPVVFVSLGVYRQWLRDQGHDDEVLFKKVRDLVTLTSISVRDRMRGRLQDISTPTNGCYELMGFDCFIDADVNPHLLECNLSPSLDVCSAPEDGGDIEKQVKGQLVHDMVSLLGLNLPPQVINGQKANDIDNGDIDNIAAQADAELARAGQFTRVFPAQDTVEDYLSFFPVPRYADIVLARHVLGKDPKPQSLTPAQTTEIIADDELALYNEKTGTLFKPSELSGWIWLQAADGVAPQAIAKELLAVHSASHGTPNAQERWQIYKNVWDVLAEWAQMGLLQHNVEDPHTIPIEKKLPDISPPSPVRAGTRCVMLNYGTPILAKTLAPLFNKASASAKVDVTVNLQRAENGYALALGSKIVATDVGLSDIGHVVSRTLFNEAARSEKEIALAGTWVQVSKNQADFFLSGHESEWDGGLSLLYAAKINKDISGGAVLNLETKTLTPIGLPIAVNDTTVDKADLLKDLTASGTVQKRHTGGRGRLLASTYQGRREAFSLRRLYIESRELNTDASKPVIEAADHHPALAALLNAAIGENGAALTGSQMQKLNSWLTGIEPHIVRPSDMAAAVEHLEK